MKTTNYTITAITATNNIAVAMFANKKHIYKTAENNKVALLETFKAILNKAKDNSELMEKPVLIITTQSILKGFTTGTFVEYLRTGCDASGKEFSETEMALIQECAELLATRTFNVRLIDEKMISPKDREAVTIKQNAFTVVKELAKQQALKDTKAEIKKQQQTAPETNSTIVLLNNELQKAIREGNIELASKYADMIARLNAPAPQQPEEETNEQEIPEDVQEEVTDEDLVNESDDIEL